MVEDPNAVALYMQQSSIYREGRRKSSQIRGIQPISDGGLLVWLTN